MLDWKSIRDLIWTSDTPDRRIFVRRQLAREVVKRDYGMSAAWYMSIENIMEEGNFFFVFADKDALEVYPAYLMDTVDLQQEWIRCVDAIRSIKSRQSKIVEGKIIEPLSTFLPNDGNYFRSSGLVSI